MSILVRYLMWQRVWCMVTVLATSETVALEEAYQAAKRRGCRNNYRYGHRAHDEQEWPTGLSNSVSVQRQ
ncbi:hypothetical protein QCD60_19495 [Pokkaliibacter sp. MBI-7]|uniref:hypothetical protein n=1 Tax=Pokkaliibacter sp. MBI-7 TaxID=3040600 RepID=UPI00244CD6BA|nr:hypothetical protein [Pokkaliibacter sp. MBI-7]MDH2434731.1 hypothetical protein [Pokkaliibacter sp. MBI-7]